MSQEDASSTRSGRRSEEAAAPNSPQEASQRSTELLIAWIIDSSSSSSSSSGSNLSPGAKIWQSGQHRSARGRTVGRCSLTGRSHQCGSQLWITAVVHRRVLLHLINRWKFWPCRGVFFFFVEPMTRWSLSTRLERVTSPRSRISADEMAWCHSCRLNQTIVIITSDIPMAFDNLRLSNSCSHVSFIAYNFRNTGWSWHQGHTTLVANPTAPYLLVFHVFFFSQDHFQFFAQGSRNKCRNYISASVLEVWRTETKLSSATENPVGAVVSSIAHQPGPKMYEQEEWEQNFKGLQAWWRSDFGSDLKAHAD